VNAATTARQTAEERRQTVLEAATKEFSAKGFYGTSTEDIARAAGISQPYLFRLFRSKKELYLAAARRGIETLYAVFADAAEGKQGLDALHAMGESYAEVMRDRDRLMLMLKCWTSSDDPDIRDASRRAWRDLVELVEQSGASKEQVASFFAHGMLMTVFMSMQLIDDPEPWSERLVAASRAALEK